MDTKEFQEDYLFNRVNYLSNGKPNLESYTYKECVKMLKRLVSDEERICILEQMRKNPKCNVYFQSKGGKSYYIKPKKIV